MSSKLIFQKYMTRLIGKMIPIYGVVARITLEKIANKTGQPYLLYNFEVVSQLSADEAVRAKGFGQGFKEIIAVSESVQAVAEAAVEAA
ncbi:MAG: hypothetical protein FWG90_00205 [Oscillospiraceae bacterium]|nr:hypothetical protein [Oscillospiraceae bacterium]